MKGELKDEGVGNSVCELVFHQSSGRHHCRYIAEPNGWLDLGEEGIDMTTDFAEWKQRKQVNRQIRADWDTIKTYVTAEGLQDGYAAVNGDVVVWMPEAATERHVFTVIDGLVYA